ncbi:MAG: hypothetical protein WBV37_16055 [Nocardioidaceae bacterium]
MTANVAIAVASAAALLALVLLWLVLRLHRLVRELQSRLQDSTRQYDAALRRLDDVASDQRATLHAVELVLQETPPPAPDEVDEPDEATAAVPLITDISHRRADADDLTTARIASVTLGGPLIKVAAFSHGVRRALDEEQRMRISYAVRKELRRQRKLRRRRRSEQAPSKGWMR